MDSNFRAETQGVDCSPGSPSLTSPIPPDGSVAPRLAQVPPPPLWNPTAAANWSLLFSPVFGSLLIRANMKALGQTERAQRAARWGVASLTWMIVSQFMQDTRTLVGLASLSFLLVWYYMAARPHILDVRRQFGPHYPRRKWGKPLGLGVIALFAAGALLQYLEPASKDPAWATKDSNPQRWLSSAFADVSPQELPQVLEALGDPDTNIAYAAAFRLHRMSQSAVSPLSTHLTHANAQVRLWAACALGMMGPAASNAAPKLPPLLKDANPGLQVAAAFAFARIGATDPQVRSEIVRVMASEELPMPELFASVQHENTPGPPICTMECNSPHLTKPHDVLSENDPEEGIMSNGTRPNAEGFFNWVARRAAQDFAATIAAQTGNPADLMPALADPQRSLKATTALFKFGQRAVPFLTALLSDADTQVREHAAFVLGCLGQNASQAIPDITALLQSEEPTQNGHCRTCGAAAFALGRMMPQSHAALFGLLRGENVTAARYAAAWLAKHPSPEVVEMLTQTLADPREHVWKAAAFALGKMGTSAEGALPALRQHLAGADPEAALTVAIALQQIAPEGMEVVPVLVDLLEHDELRVRKAAVLATCALLEGLQGINGKTEVKGPLALASWTSGDLPNVLKALVLLAQEDDNEVRPEAVRCLGLIPEPTEPVFNALLKAISAHNEHVQNHAAQALVRHGRLGLPSIRMALRDPSAAVRRWVVYALRDANGEELQTAAVDLLIQGLADPQPSVRKTAAESLGHMARNSSFSNGRRAMPSREKVVPALTRQLTNADWDIKVEAALTLADLQATGPQAKQVLTEASQMSHLPRATRDRVSFALRPSE